MYREVGHLFTLIIISNVLEVHSGRINGVTQIMGTGNLAVPARIRGYFPARTDIPCKCMSYFTAVLCPSKQMEKYNVIDPYICCPNCSIQELFQKCTKGLDNSLASMKQAKSEIANEVDHHCNGGNFVADFKKKMQGRPAECIKKAEKICPGKIERKLSLNQKRKILSKYHRLQVKQTHTPTTVSQDMKPESP